MQETMAAAYPHLQNILLAEDDPRDVELTLAALEGRRLANQVFVVHDGEEALDYLHRRGNSNLARAAIPLSCCSTTKCPRSAAWKSCGP